MQLLSTQLLSSRYFPACGSTSSSRRSGAIGQDCEEFGLDVEGSKGMPGYSDPPEMRTKTYGSISDKARSADLADTATKLHSSMRQLLIVVASLWILYMALGRFSAVVHGTASEPRERAPAPAPGTPSAAPRCPSYTYPQCEAAIHWYLAQSAKSRCEAFERVKAEGDFFAFPYSPTRQDICTEPGCCGCSGQCSKCPPLLPECVSWQLDGSWKVAFSDGSEAKYTFDANGHCEAKLDATALPVTWKEYPQAYLPEGSDAIAPLWLTVEKAKEQCEDLAECKGITYNTATKTGENFRIYFKTMSAITPGAGLPWKTVVKDQWVHLHGTAAVAGVLTQVPTDAKGTFRLDLHKAAPHLFPVGSIEQLVVSGEELRVQQRVAGKKMLEGTGVRAK